LVVGWLLVSLARAGPAGAGSQVAGWEEPGIRDGDRFGGE
jgi:hypothetical protein